MKEICTDLERQYRQFDDLVSAMDNKNWYSKTPFYEWSVFDQVAHIAFFDHEALMAVENPDRFRERAKGLMEMILSGGNWPEYINPLLGPQDPEELLFLWRGVRDRLIGRLSEMPAGERMCWYGPDMGARSFATARLMETWAHSQDVYDTLEKRRNIDAGLLHVSRIGVATFGWSFRIRKQAVPESTPRVELTGPSGEAWEWGEANGQEWVRGSAEEFCLVVTQRRNIADTSLVRQGEYVEKWLNAAQAFAGVAQEPPAPGVRVVDYPE